MVNISEDWTLAFSAFLDPFKLFKILLSCILLRKCDSVALWVLLHLNLIPFLEFAQGVASILFKEKLGQIDPVAIKESLVLACGVALVDILASTCT